jgi:hypothetical protein
LLLRIKAHVAIDAENQVTLIVAPLEEVQKRCNPRVME